MDYRHDPQKLDVASAANRRHYVTKAKEWTRHQSARLRVTEAEMLAAICRGWLPEQVERVASRYHLESLPPALPDVPAFVDFRIAQAVAKGDTALEAAFKKARAA